MSASPLGLTPVDTRAGLDPSFVPPPGATPLDDDRLVFRAGDRLYRPAGPWTTTVHALLRHLEQVGFDGAPRLVDGGLDPSGRQVLTYVDGELVHPYAWSDDAIVAVGRMLRRLHDATLSFVPPDGATWRPWYTHRPGADPVIGHGDV